MNHTPDAVHRACARERQHRLPAERRRRDGLAAMSQFGTETPPGVVILLTLLWGALRQHIHL